MSEDMINHDRSAECHCVRDHVPNPKVMHKHHIVPKAWGGTDAEPPSWMSDDQSNLVVLCPTAHSNVHRLLNDYVRHKGKPPWSLVEHYTHYERELAGTAWIWWSEHHDIDVKAPWTTPEGVAVVYTD